MKILESQLDEASLTSLAMRASELLLAKNFTALAREFGYAVAYDREPAKAIMEDYDRRVLECAELKGDGLAKSHEIWVNYFKPNSTGFLAAVECQLPVNNTACLFFSLVAGLNRNGDHYLYLESISSMA